MAAKVDSEKCVGCESCVGACPVEAISMNDGKAAGVINGCWIMSSVQAAADQSGKWAIVNMPKLDGIAALTRLREASNVPVILLTAKSEDTDKIQGLNLGADDYVTKPFSLAVLRARVNRLLRRGSAPAAALELGPFSFDFERLRFMRNGTEVELSKTEQRLLRLLVENQGNTLSRSLLIDRIWPDGAEYVDENALSVTIKRLRDKLGAHNFIQTVYGIGYCWRKKNGQ